MRWFRRKKAFQTPVKASGKTHPERLTWEEVGCGWRGGWERGDRLTRAWRPLKAFGLSPESPHGNPRGLLKTQIWRSWKTLRGLPTTFTTFRVMAKVLDPAFKAFCSVFYKLFFSYHLCSKTSSAMPGHSAWQWPPIPLVFALVEKLEQLWANHIAFWSLSVPICTVRGLD